jgi:S-disulfanyl-L-cysteine oxidoreductase SoxD
MSRFRMIVLALVAAPIVAPGQSPDAAFRYPDRFYFGETVSASRLESILTAIPPDGEGLPDGSGTFEQGRQVYTTKCVACHGQDLGGTPVGMQLIGGRGSLATDAPVATVESYWPYATSVFSYIRNTMPTTAPGSLTDDESYAVTAYILGMANIIPVDMALNEDNLASVVMPNRNGFVPDPRPDVPAGAAVHCCPGRE